MGGVVRGECGNILIIFLIIFVNPDRCDWHEISDSRIFTRVSKKRDRSELMRNGPYDDLEEEYIDTRRTLFDAAFGRIASTAESIGRLISHFGTLRRLLGK
jgi:hypothetical protein